MIVFDTETTGFLAPQRSPIEEQPFIIELGAIKVDDETLEVKETFSELFKIGFKLPPKITDITGISDSDLMDKRTFSEAFPDVKKFFEGESVWCGHNVMFDFDVLRYNLERIGKSEGFPYPTRKICTVNESVFLKGYRLKLGKLFELATGKPIKGWHRAVSDAESTLECYKWLRGNHGVI
jgi:DNA polymerase III epsilon subunit-like protein